MTVVPFVKLNSGYSIPQIGLGVYELPDKELCKTVVSDALAVGYRLIDSAQFYHNEQFVSEAIRESGLPREEVFVTTKIYQGFDNKEDLRANIQNSLDNLDLGYIDLFLMHSPLCGKEQRISTWRFLNEIMEEGGEKGIIRAIGVSNFGVNHLRQLEEAGLPAPAVNQIEPGKGWDAPALRDLSKKYNKSIAQVLLRWSIEKGYSPQPKASSLSRLRENIDIFDFALTPEEIQRIDMEMDLTKDNEYKGKRIALEWNPVNCD